MKKIKRVIATFMATALLLALFPIGVVSVSAIDIERVITASLTILGYNEGSYSSVNANDNGALSIGKLQWHAGRALSLMRTIVNSLGAASAKNYLGESLYNEIVSSSTNWKTRTLTADEKSKFSSVLATDASKAAQDSLARTDVGVYANNGIQRGITSDSALVYYCDIENQYGSGGALNIVNSVKNYLGKNTIDTLDEFHDAVLQVVTGHLTRRTNTYNYCKSLNWDIVLPDPPEFVITASATGNTVDLHWTNQYASSYYIYTYRYESDAVTYETNVGQTTNCHLELALGTYTVGVIANFSDGSQKSTSVDFVLPAEGYTVSVNTVNNTAGVSWQNIGASSYWVYVWNKATVTEVYSASAGSSTYSFLTLSKGEYSVTVTAYMPDGSSRAATTSFTIGKKVTITVDPNGGVLNGKTDIQSYNIFSDEAVQINVPQREGYVFSGWGIDGPGELLPKSQYYNYGKQIYSDAKFYESIEVYNNNNNGAVTHALLNADGDCPSTSGKMIKITTSGQASPALGGFVQYTTSSAKSVYYHVFTAKVPVGYTLNNISNDIGYQGTREWITDNKGTGEWKTYIYRVDCGFIGNFQTFGHVYLSADEGSPNSVIWYLCSSNIYDATEIINGKDTDPCFTVGQPLEAYNNLNNGSVALSRISNTDPSCPSSSSYYLQIKTSGAASPGLGGVYFSVNSKANGVFYQVMVAKIPVGYEIERASNACGDGYTVEWLTDNKGTGNWETYICKTICGATGSFGTLGHWYIKALNGQTTVTWYACYVNYFDSTPMFYAGSGDAALTAQWEAIEYKSLLGDPDYDGEITVADALIALRIAAKLAEETPEMIATCDTDGDGAITVADALQILRVAAKLVSLEDWLS